MIRIRIVSDGSYFNTRVENAATGEAIADVAHVSWESARPGEPSRAYLEIVNVAVDVVGDLPGEDGPAAEPETESS